MTPFVFLEGIETAHLDRKINNKRTNLYVRERWPERSFIQLIVLIAPTWPSVESGKEIHH